MNVFFTLIFAIGVYYLIRYPLNLKKAAELSDDALFPKNESEFNSILAPNEWKEMEPFTKGAKSYQYVKWGTMLALVLLTILMWIVLTTDLGSSFFSVAYLFFAIINVIKHRGNLYIFPKGIILNGKYYSSKQIEDYETEKIIRWHDLYGLNPRVNNGYKLTIKVKRTLFQPNFLVVADRDHLKQITSLLNEQGIYGIKNEKI